MRFQFARPVERVDEIVEGIKGHTPAKLTGNPTACKQTNGLILKARKTVFVNLKEWVYGDETIASERLSPNPPERSGNANMNITSNT